jgi:hypothetical protein
MTGVRQLNVAAAICYVPFAQIPVIRRRIAEPIISTGPDTGGMRQLPTFVLGGPASALGPPCIHLIPEND